MLRGQNVVWPLLKTGITCYSEQHTTKLTCLLTDSLVLHCKRSKIPCLKIRSGNSFIRVTPSLSSPEKKLNQLQDILPHSPLLFNFTCTGSLIICKKKQMDILMDCHWSSEVEHRTVTDFWLSLQPELHCLLHPLPLDSLASTRQTRIQPSTWRLYGHMQTGKSKRSCTGTLNSH